MNIFSNGINYSDGETPTVMTANIEAIGYEGWYYKNSASNKKITWYIPLGNTSLLISDLTMIYASLHILNTEALPFITVYTAPRGFNDAGTWYHSKSVFTVPETTVINKNTNYCFYATIDSEDSDITIDGHTNIRLDVNSSGTYESTDVIKYISFCTPEDAAAGEAEFILSDINLLKPDGDIELFLSNNELFSSVNVDVDTLVLSNIDNRAPGIVPTYAFLNPMSVTKVSKTANLSLKIGHNGLINDTIIDNLKMPRLANVAGKGDSSIAIDNTNTLFNNFFYTLDFSVETNVPSAQFTVESWGLDCTTRTKVFVNEKGDIKIMYRGVDLFSKGCVLPGDIILDASSNPTEYGWTTHTFPGTLIPGSWYRLIQTIHFSEELYGDQVQMRLYELSAEDGNVIDIVLWDVLDNTWEAFYINHPSQAKNGNMPPSVDSIQIHCCDAPRNMDIATIKNITYSTSKTVQVASIDDLLPSTKGIVTFLAGNSTGKSIAAITGLQYLFEASGGYQMERGFNNIAFRTQDLIQRFDVTDAVQIKLNAGLFNEKLGLIKDASNLNIVSTSYDTISDGFTTDSITISPSDFINSMSASNIISVGKYSTMYSDFISYVRKYFGYTGGFSSLFQAASEFDISGGVFNANSFMSLISSGQKIVADDVNAVNTAPTLYYKFTNSTLTNGKVYEEVAKDYTGTIGVAYVPDTKLDSTCQKWGTSALLTSNVGSNADGIMTDRYIVPGVTGMTFSFWVNILDNEAGTNQIMFTLGNVFNMAVRGSYLISPYINCTNGNYAATLNTLDGFVCGTWNYISLTVDPSGVWKYYLNGGLKQTISIPSGNAYGYPSTTAALRLQIGASKGYYNEFLYYDRILSATEIANLYGTYTINNGATISSWVKFSSLDTTPRTVWSFYDTINKNTISLYATNTKYAISKSGSTNYTISFSTFIASTLGNSMTVSTLTYPYTPLNGLYIFSASSNNTHPYHPTWQGTTGNCWWGGNTSGASGSDGYTANPYTILSGSAYSYSGGGTGKFWTTVVDGLTISGEWWQIKFPIAIPIVKYGVGNAGSNSIYPNTWYAAGSNDGTTWTQIDYRTNQTYLTAYDTAQPTSAYSTTTSQAPFLYFRLIFTKTNSNAAFFAVGNFQLFTTVDATLTLNVNAVPTTNAWTHIATVFDNGQQNNKWTTYINNVAYSSILDINNINLPYISFSNSVNAIGMDASSGLNKMHGYIDDVAIYKSVFSPAKIASIYNGYDSLCKVADYTFDTNSLTNYSLANYTTGSAVYDASITNLSLMTASGEKLGSGCLYFPNKTYPGAVTLGKMSFPDQSAFSFSTWANFSSLDNSGAISTIFSMYSANSNILLSATASKYTLAIKNTIAPVYIEAITGFNLNSNATTVTGLGYPYCRNGLYTSSSSSLGNNSYIFYMAAGNTLSTSALYTSASGEYTGTAFTYANNVDPSNIPYGTNAITGVKFNPQSIILTLTTFQDYAVALNITADGQRIVYASRNGYIYYATYNNSTGAWNTPIKTLETTSRTYRGLAITLNGSRCVVSTSAALYFCTWNGTNYSALTQTLNTNITDLYMISLSADGSKLLAIQWTTVNKPMWASWNGTNYSTFTDTLESSRNYSGCCISNDGTRIAYTAGNNTNVYWADWNGTNFGVGTLISNTTNTGTSGKWCVFSSDKSKLYISTTNSAYTNKNYYTTFNSATGNYGNFSVIPLTVGTETAFDSFGYRETSSNSFELYSNQNNNATVYKIVGYTGGYGVSGEYVQIKLPYNLNLTQYLMNCRYAPYNHKNFCMFGSTDGNIWDILSYNTNSITDNGLISSRNLVYYLSNTKYYSYYRMTIVQTNNTTVANFFSIKLRGYAQESINYTMNCSVSPVIDDWNHVAGTLSNNGVNGIVKLYINNTPYTFTTDPSSILYPAFGIDSSYNNITIGMDASGALNKMVGYIDDTKFYNASLSASQISSLYNNQSLVEPSLAKYNFNTETVSNGQIANYASGSPVYDSTITNTSLVSSTGQRSGSGALYFPSTAFTGTVRLGNFTYDTSINVVRNGALWYYKFDVSQNAGGYIYDTTSGNYNMSNTYLNTLNSISTTQSAVTGGRSLKSNAGTTAVYYAGNIIYTIPKDAAMTFAFWVYINSNVSNNGKGVLGIANAAGTSVISVKVSGTTTYNLSLQTIFGGTTTTNIPSATITPETWTYVCWTITTAGVWKYYINGALQQTIAANVKPYFSATRLFAASAHNTAGFYGYLDEYRYYERELTAAEITSQYNYYTIAPGATVTNDLSGSITISNIKNLLRNAVDANVFGNRTPNVGTGIATDPNNRSNYGVGDGFLDGDIIWVPAGTTIKLSVGIDTESFLPINNVGPATSATYMAAQDTNYGSGNFSQATSATTTKISRTLKAPLMIRVTNL